MTTPIRVLVAEDIELVRFGLCRSLEMSGEVNIVAEARNGEEAIAYAHEHHPELILMDIRMPSIDGIETTRRLKQEMPEVKIVVLTESTLDKNVLDCLLAGADGYCLKNTSISAITAVMHHLLSDNLVSFDANSFNVIRNLLREQQHRFVSFEDPSNSMLAPQLRQELASLSPREREVLQLIVDGKSNKEIANYLKLTFHTAKAHVCRVIQKLAVDDRTQAAVKAMQAGYAPNKKQA